MRGVSGAGFANLRDDQRRELAPERSLVPEELARGALRHGDGPSGAIATAIGSGRCPQIAVIHTRSWGLREEVRNRHR